MRLLLKKGSKKLRAINLEILRPYAKRYIWWQTPDEALHMPQRVIAQVMNLGTFEDMQKLAKEVGDDVLSDVIAHAEPGQFTPRAWAYWHYRLNLADVDQVPELPVRRFA